MISMSCAQFVAVCVCISMLPNLACSMQNFSYKKYSGTVDNKRDIRVADATTVLTMARCLHNRYIQDMNSIYSLERYRAELKAGLADVEQSHKRMATRLRLHSLNAQIEVLKGLLLQTVSTRKENSALMQSQQKILDDLKAKEGQVESSTVSQVTFKLNDLLERDTHLNRDLESLRERVQPLVNERRVIENESAMEPVTKEEIPTLQRDIHTNEEVQVEIRERIRRVDEKKGSMSC